MLGWSLEIFCHETNRRNSWFIWNFACPLYRCSIPFKCFHWNSVPSNGVVIRMLRKTPGFSSFKIGDSQRQKLWEQLHVIDVHIQSIGLIIKWLCSQYHRIFFLRHSLYGLLISIIFVFSFTLTIKFAVEVFLWRSKQKLCYALNFSTLIV